MSRLFRLIQRDADPYTVDVLITDWEGAHDVRLQRAGPLPRVYLQLYELDRDGAHDNLGRIELSVVGTWDLTDGRAVRSRFFVEDPRYVAPAEGRDTGDYLRVRLPVSDPDREPIAWFEQWVPLRVDPEEREERTYQVDFTFKRGREGELLAPRPPDGQSRARRPRDRRMAVIPRGGRPTFGPHPGCVVPALQDLIAEFRNQMESLRSQIREHHQRAMICEYVVQLATQGVDEWWDHFQDWRSAADARREGARCRRVASDQAEALESAARLLLQRWREAEHDLVNHHTPAERMELMKLVLGTGVAATEAGTRWAISSQGAHPVEGRLWRVLSWDNAQTVTGAALDILDELYPSWVQLSASTVVLGTRQRVGPLVERELPRQGLGPGVELLELHTRTGQINVYRVNPAVQRVVAGAQHLNALLRVASVVATIAKLRQSDVGLNRNTAEAAGAAVGAAGDLAQWVRFVQLRQVAHEAGSSVSAATTLTKAASRVSTGLGVGVALLDAVANVGEDDLDAAFCNATLAVGMILMEVPHPYAVVAGLVLCVASFVGSALLEDSPLQQWALNGPYGRRRLHPADRALTEMQIWVARRVARITVRVPDAGPGTVTLRLVLESTGAFNRGELAATVKASSGDWRYTMPIDLLNPNTAPGASVTRRPNRTEVEVMAQRAGGPGVQPYAVEATVRLVADGLKDPETAAPLEVLAEYRQAVEQVGGVAGGPDDRIGGG